MRDTLSKAVRKLIRAFSRPFDPYRPELHYMRGPGPKCAAKRADDRHTAESDAAAPGEIADLQPDVVIRAWI
jgi:hypothetical protein